jgi:hypothetical protein
VARAAAEHVPLAGRSRLDGSNPDPRGIEDLTMHEPPYREPPIDPSGSAASVHLEVHHDARLVVTRIDQADRGTRDERGLYDYLYLFATYELAMANAPTYHARRYADDWRRVAIFVPPGVLPPGKGGSIPYHDDAFAIVASYFLGLDDVDCMEVFLLGEYVPVDPALVVLSTR